MEGERKLTASVIRESLSIALIELLKKKDYNEISITELCKRAGVSRTGFYRHYYDKSEIIDDIIEDLFEKYKAESRFRGGQNLNMEEWYEKLFTFIRGHFELLSVLMDKKFSQQFLVGVNNHLLNMTPPNVIDMGHTLIWAGALYNLVFYWINSDNPSKIETVVKMCTDYLPVSPFEIT